MDFWLLVIIAFAVFFLGYFCCLTTWVKHRYAGELYLRDPIELRLTNGALLNKEPHYILIRLIREENKPYSEVK